MEIVRALLSCLLLCCLVSCTSSSRADVAREQIPVGMLRDEAIQILEAESWYHAVCQRGVEGIEDLFFFGSQDYDRAEVLIVLSMLQNDKYLVKNIGTFESYAWHTAYRDCVQRDMFK